MSFGAEDKFGRVAALRPARKSDAGGTRAWYELPSDPHKGQDESDRLAELVGASVARNRYGEHLIARRWYSTPEACEPSPDALRLLLPKGPERAASAAQFTPAQHSAAVPSQWLFLDTETTGLAGGTGTYAFLVGLAWWDAGGLQVEQFFMRDHGEEHSLLLEVSRRLAERRVLVTFNGKSFDWPLLETRFRMTRAIAPRAPAAHLDLLHPARQLWRLRLGSVRLTELERHVLGERLDWTRVDDIDSALIPQLYFDYLRGGQPGPLAGVFRHNQMDLRGLAALAGKIFSLLTTRDSSEGAEPATCATTEGFHEHALELFGLSRMLRRRGDTARARRLYERAIEVGLPVALDLAARRELALLAKRERDYARAASLWENLVRDSADGLDAYEQLAIYYEHRARKPHRAAQLTREALAALRKASRAGGVDPRRLRRIEARLAHRLARLSRKTVRPLLVPFQLNGARHLALPKRRKLPAPKHGQQVEIVGTALEAATVEARKGVRESNPDRRTRGGTCSG